MRPTKAFTLVELLMVIALVTVAVALLTAQRGQAQDDNDIKKNNSQLRGIHQCMVIFASSNNTYLPGLDPQSKVLPDGEASTGKCGSGAAPASRLWILLNGKLLPPSLLISPREPEMPDEWKNGKLPPESFSYALLQIDNPKDDAGRLAEWRDNANSQAIMLGDRNTGRENADKKVKSLWTQRAGDWAGGVVFGDNHAEHATTHNAFVTRYMAIVTKGDNLFATAPSPADQPKVTEGAANPTTNAMLYRD